MRSTKSADLISHSKSLPWQNSMVAVWPDPSSLWKVWLARLGSRLKGSVSLVPAQIPDFLNEIWEQDYYQRYTTLTSSLRLASWTAGGGWKGGRPNTRLSIFSSTSSSSSLFPLLSPLLWRCFPLLLEPSVSTNAPKLWRLAFLLSMMFHFQIKRIATTCASRGASHAHLHVCMGVALSNLYTRYR